MDWWGSAKRAFWSSVVGGVLTQFIYGSEGSRSVLGFVVPDSVAAGAACGAGSIVADITDKYAPSTPVFGIPHVGTGLLELAAAGLTTSVVLDYLGLSTSSVNLEGVALGAVAVVGGRYADSSMGGGSFQY